MSVIQLIGLDLNQGGDASGEGATTDASSPVQQTKERGSHPNGTEATNADVQLAKEEEGTEEDEWEQACRLHAEFDEGMWDAAICNPPKHTSELRTFQASKKFDEMRIGMEFKKGVMD